MKLKKIISLPKYIIVLLQRTVFHRRKSSVYRGLGVGNRTSKSAVDRWFFAGFHYIDRCASNGKDGGQDIGTLEIDSRDGRCLMSLML